MGQENDEIWAKLASLEDIRDYRFFSGRNTDNPDVEILDEWKTDLEPVQILKTLLVLIDEKNGCTFAQSFESREKAVELAESLSENGLNVWMGIGRENDDIYVEFFISAEDYPEDFFDNHRDRRNNQRKNYHREMGEFFGYPRKSIETFSQGPSLLDRLWNVFAFNITSLHIRRGNIIYSQQALDKYGQDLSEQERKDFLSLIYYVLDDSRESFDNAVEEAEERRKAIEKVEEETDTDFLYLQDKYLELLETFDQS